MLFVYICIVRFNYTFAFAGETSLTCHDPGEGGEGANSERRRVQLYTRERAYIVFLRHNNIIVILFSLLSIKIPAMTRVGLWETSFILQNRLNSND